VIHGSLNEATHGSMDHPLMMHSLFACQMLRRTKLMKGILSWQAHRYASKQAQVKLWQCSAKLWSAKVANPACVQTSNQWGIPLAARTSSKLGSSCLQMFNWCFIISTNLHYARLWRTSSSCSSKKSNLDSVLQTSGTPGPVLFWWSGSWKYSVLLPVLVLEIRLDFGPILGIPVWNWHYPLIGPRSRPFFQNKIILKNFQFWFQYQNWIQNQTQFQFSLYYLEFGTRGSNQWNKVINKQTYLPMLGMY
jgi:hypothetical protein